MTNDTTPSRGDHHADHHARRDPTRPPPPHAPASGPAAVPATRRGSDQRRRPQPPSRSGDVRTDHAVALGPRAVCCLRSHPPHRTARRGRGSPAARDHDVRCARVLHGVPSRGLAPSAPAHRDRGGARHEARSGLVRVHLVGRGVVAAGFTALRRCRELTPTRSPRLACGFAPGILPDVDDGGVGAGGEAGHAACASANLRHAAATTEHVHLARHVVGLRLVAVSAVLMVSVFRCVNSHSPARS